MRKGFTLHFQLKTVAEKEPELVSAEIIEEHVANLRQSDDRATVELLKEILGSLESVTNRPSYRYGL